MLLLALQFAAASFSHADIVINEVVAGVSDRALHWDSTVAPHLGAGTPWQAADTAPMQFLIDYDDAFVAYINGVELARANVGAANTFKPYDAVAATKRNNTGKETVVTIDQPAELLVAGNNVLSIQSHKVAGNYSSGLWTANGDPTEYNNASVHGEALEQPATMERLYPGTPPAGYANVNTGLGLRNTGSAYTAPRFLVTARKATSNPNSGAWTDPTSSDTSTQKQMFNGGALVESNVLARWNALKSQMTPFQPTVNDYVTHWENGTGSLPSRRQVLLGYTNSFGNSVQGILVGEGLWPATAAPTLSKFGGAVAPGSQFTLTNPNGVGTIYYTLDGSDPRLVGGAVHGTVYSGALTVNQTTGVKARVLNTNREWSPLTAAVFTVSQTPAMAITELMHHPPLTGTNTTEDEFIEIKNTGTASVNLSGMSFTNGVTYTFPAGSVLAADAFAVLVKDQAQFAALPERRGGGRLHRRPLEHW